MKTVKETPEKKAFKLLTICQFIAARTPMILGYAPHTDLTDRIIRLSSELGTSAMTTEIAESQGWHEIKKILDI